VDEKPMTSEKVLNALAAKLQGERFFGIVEVHFQDGRVVRVRKMETFEPREFERMTAK
jgi:hypothetical protein